MIIADTSVWIEFFRKRDPIFEIFSAILERREVIGLAWIFGELLQGARNQSEGKVIEHVWRFIPKPELALGEQAWIKAGKESQKGKWTSKGVGLIDAAIVSVAIEMKTPVWTLDQKLSQILKFKRLLWLP